MNYPALKTLIEGNPALAGLNDEAIAAALNARTVPVQGDITVAQALTWCAAAGIVGTITDAAAQPAHPLRSVCLAVTHMFNNLEATFALSSPNIQGLLSAFVAGGIITAEQRGQLNAMGSTLTSAAEQTVGQLVSHTDVAVALRGGN